MNFKNLLMGACGLAACAAGAVVMENAALRVDASVFGTTVWRAGEDTPFAEFAPAPEGISFEVHLEGDLPFLFIDVAPSVRAADRTVGRLDLPRITLAPFAAKPKAMSYAGLTDVDGHSGAFGYLAVAEPFTRKGVVAAWLTNRRASGIVKSGFAADGRVVLEPFAEYGRMLVKANAAVAPDTFVFGAFEDCRLGLEAYADAAAARNGVQLPPQISGYTTWYPDRYGYSDRSKYKDGCGAGDEASTKEFADKAKELRLGEYGFTFFQCDDQWQCGKYVRGPARQFDRTNPEGPYPNGFKVVTDYLAERGFVTGLWWMPFGGMSGDPWWEGKEELYVKCAADVADNNWGNAREGASPAQKAGAPFETRWGGTCLDMTNPKARAYVADIAHRITYDWGMRYIKYDGMWTGYAADILCGKSWKNDHFANAVFADPTVPNLAAYRLGVQTMREAAAPGTFILACNLAQNARSLVPSIGLVDGMRIGGDNGPIDLFPDRYRKGPESATVNYFLNGRTWYNDPDPVYVRNVVPLSRARTFATFTSLAGALYNFSDWLPDLAPERVDVLKRTLAPHGFTTVRPIDYFETALPNAWVLDAGETKVFGLYNWNTNENLKIDYPAAYAGLDPEKTYVAFDYWNNRFLPAFKGALKAKVKKDDCRVLAVHEALARPFLLSTSRHVASPAFDVKNLAWRDGWWRPLVFAPPALEGESQVVKDDAYELRFIVPAPWRVKNVSVDGAEPVRVRVRSPGAVDLRGIPGGRFTLAGDYARFRFTPRKTGAVRWRVAFEK